MELVPKKTMPCFKPGQFLHLAIDPYEPTGFWPESRVFSIASSPIERNRLKLCYSVKGVYTKRMEQELTEGGTVWVKLPYGDFVIDQNHDVVLVAGGTGISAFVAFIENLAEPMNRKVHLVYGVRSSKLLLWDALIREKTSSMQDFNAQVFIEDFNTGDLCVCGKMGNGLANHRGIIAVDTMLQSIREPLSFIYYLSGPPIMLRDIRTGLIDAGVAPEGIKIDAWE